MQGNDKRNIIISVLVKFIRGILSQLHCLPSFSKHLITVRSENKAYPITENKSTTQEHSRCLA